MDDVRHLSELFHKMKADLLSKGNANLNLLRSVYDASNDLCKFRYEKPSINNQTSYLESLNRSRASLNSRQVRNFIRLDNFPFLGQYHRGHINQHPSIFRVECSKLTQSGASSFLLCSIEGLNGAHFFVIGSVYLIKTAFFGLFE